MYEIYKWRTRVASTLFTCGRGRHGGATKTHTESLCRISNEKRGDDGKKKRDAMEKYEVNGETVGKKRRKVARKAVFKRAWVKFW